MMSGEGMFEKSFADERNESVYIRQQAKQERQDNFKAWKAEQFQPKLVKR